MQAAVPGFPFSAVVGHDDLRLALLLNAVHPGVGGVLVRGEKGTAKSTAVRALAALLPALDVVPGCRFGCAPTDPDPACPDGPHVPGPADHRPARLVELPVGATEDRLVGSLDLERALAEGVRAYQPGLLAEAHRGVLYVDEVNLLHDHLVDLLLDAAAMGRAHVERDGVSVSHAARFLLVGTMNPEEGELRPQLLDRFGLAVEVRAARDVDTRVEVVRRRMAFEADPVRFADSWSAAEVETAERISAAQARLGSVLLPEVELRRIAAVCAAFDVDGMRADLVIARAALAHAAWRGADVVAEQDVRVAARLALPHRRRRDPFDEPGMDESALDDALRDADPDPDPDPDGGGGGAPPPDAGPTSPDDAPTDDAPTGRAPSWRAAAGHVPEPGRTDRRGAAGDPVPGPGAARSGHRRGRAGPAVAGPHRVRPRGARLRRRPAPRRRRAPAGHHHRRRAAPGRPRPGRRRAAAAPR